VIRRTARRWPQGATIRVTTARHNGCVELHVVDEGPGLGAAARARAFDRFWHAGAAGEGSGLGLPIARRLVAVDEGNIELLDADTGGVDAVVRLRPG
jgi:K+-sensing histidine kinase KdpD